MGDNWNQHLNSFSSMLHMSYQNKQPITPSAFFDQLAQQACDRCPNAGQLLEHDLHAAAPCLPAALQLTPPPAWLQMEYALPQGPLEAADLPAVVGESSSEEDSENGVNGQLGMAFIQALSAQGLLPGASGLPGAPRLQLALPSTSSQSLSEGQPAEEFLDLAQAGEGQEGPVDALAKSMQDFMLGSFAAPRPRRPLRVVRNPRTRQVQPAPALPPRAQPAGRPPPQPPSQPQAPPSQPQAPPPPLPQQQQQQQQQPPRKSPRNGQRSSMSPRRSHGKRAAPMQAPDAAAPLRRLGEAAPADADSAASSEPDATQPLTQPQSLPAASLEGLPASWAQLAAQYTGPALSITMLDSVDNLGRAPLHVAAAAGREDIVMQLVQAGCDTSRWLTRDYRCSLQGSDLHAAGLWLRTPAADGLQMQICQPVGRALLLPGGRCRSVQHEPTCMLVPAERAPTWSSQTGTALRPAGSAPPPCWATCQCRQLCQATAPQQMHPAQDRLLGLAPGPSSRQHLGQTAAALGRTGPASRPPALSTAPRCTWQPSMGTAM